MRPQPPGQVGLRRTSTFLAALILILASACSKEPSAAEKLAQNIHEKATSLCRPWFGSSLPDSPDPLPPDTGRAPAKALAIQISGDNEIDSPSYVSIPSSIEATSESDLHSLICRKNTSEQVGSYTDAAQANKQLSIVTILSWPDGKPLSRKLFYGGDPPAVATGTRGAQGGPAANNDINAWLQSVVT